MNQGKLVQCEADKTPAWRAVENLFTGKKVGVRKHRRSINGRKKSSKNPLHTSAAVVVGNGRGASAESFETAENITLPKRSTSAERMMGSSGNSSSSLVDQTELGAADGQNSQGNGYNGSVQNAAGSMNDMDRQYLAMLDNKDGFGISPSHGSPTKSLVKRTSMELVNRNLSPTRQAVHKQIGGRII